MPGIAAAQVRADRAQEPFQNPGRSRVIWIGRCAGESRCSVSGTRPPASAGCSVRPNNSCTRKRNARAAFGLVVDGRRRSRRRDKMRRRLGLKPPRQVVRQQRVQRCGEIVGADLGKARLADEKRRQPVGRGRQRLVARGRARRSGSARRRNMTRSRHCLRLFVHGSRATPRPSTPSREGERARVVGGDAQGLLGENERAQPPSTARAQRGGGAVEASARRRSRSRRRRSLRSPRASAARR